MPLAQAPSASARLPAGDGAASRIPTGPAGVPGLVRSVTRARPGCREGRRRRAGGPSRPARSSTPGVTRAHRRSLGNERPPGPEKDARGGPRASIRVRGGMPMKVMNRGRGDRLGPAVVAGAGSRVGGGGIVRGPGRRPGRRPVARAGGRRTSSATTRRRRSATATALSSHHLLSFECTGAGGSERRVLPHRVHGQMAVHNRRRLTSTATVTMRSSGTPGHLLQDYMPTTSPARRPTHASKP